MKKRFLSLLCLSAFLFAEEETGYMVNFPNVSMIEAVKFVSKIAGVNFIGDQNALDFEISFISGRPSKSEEILAIFLQILDQHDLEAVEKNGCYLIRTKSDVEPLPIEIKEIAPPPKTSAKFYVYKLQYHQGSEILQAIKQISSDIIASNGEDLTSTIQSLQWISSTNSLFFSGQEASLAKIRELIESIDTPLKQVFIELLVIETNINNSLDFGVKWSSSAKYKGNVGMGFGGFPNHSGKDPFSQTMQSIGPDNPPAGASQIPMGRGFDLGIIGDIIFHKGKSFFSLGSLVSALQAEGDCSIILNQKIITQENKNSKIFVGDNIPFAGSVIETIGVSQQTTANIEYRDVGVSLSITPLLGNKDIITLEISEEITEAIDLLTKNSSQLSGIKTSKTNMATSAHVPDGHFLILSGMTRNVKRDVKTGLPCLGGIPLLGNLFSRKESILEKSNILIFVKPHIIHSSREYQDLTEDITIEHGIIEAVNMESVDD